MGGVAHVGAGGGIGGQHAALGGRVLDQQVDAHGAGRIEPLDHRHGRDVEAERRDQRERLQRRRLAGLDRAPRSLSSWNSSARRAARVDTQTGGISSTVRHGRLGRTCALPST
jgi:hypothetical protein